MRSGEPGSPATLEALLRHLAERAPWPGAGAAAGLVAAVAADLVEEAARGSADVWTEAGAAIAQAAALRSRVLPMAREDAKAYEAARSALAAVSDRPPFRQPGDVPLGPALARAADVPLEIAEAATDVAGLAAWVAERAHADARADAAGAALLAVGAVEACAHLVDVNLSTRPGDERATRAHELSDLARAASERALAAAD